jgi:SAM-dependent methyltransferase
MTEQGLPPFFHTIFAPSLPRLGPGDDALTNRALDVALGAAPPLEGELRILDIGCGTGAPTLQIARRTSGPITAIDNYQPYLDELMRRAGRAGFADRIRPGLIDIREPLQDEGTYDLIWSEGALSLSAGLANGLALCRRLLAPHGRLGVSDLCWLRPDPPAECRAFLDPLCPEMGDVDSTLRLIADTGLACIDHFTVPESCWLDSYFAPLEHRMQHLRAVCGNEPDHLALLDAIENERDMYRRYSEYWGYEFFVMRRA